ncbi:MAG: DUF4157 domain-containing protein [Dehalococcoidales bacterium]|nr:DUF4157 domain-containing protein [Dehalococcoidales bacterium]
MTDEARPEAASLTHRARRLESFAALLARGRRLYPAERSWLEPLLGRDLGDLVVHTDEQSARLAGRLQASAFAAGRRVFAPPGIGEGVLAHEAAHVVQQTAPAAAAELPLALPEAGRTGGAAGRRPVVQASAAEPGGTEGQEAAARSAAEAAVDRPRTRTATPIDVDDLADRVYVLLQEEALTERERLALPPW